MILDIIAQKLTLGQNCRLDKCKYSFSINNYSNFIILVEIIAHLRLLKELVPDYCSIEPLKNSVLGGSCEYMKLNAKIDLNKVRFALNSFKQQN
jgi:hypothetical protein